MHQCRYVEFLYGYVYKYTWMYVYIYEFVTHSCGLYNSFSFDYAPDPLTTGAPVQPCWISVYMRIYVYIYMHICEYISMDICIYTHICIYMSSWLIHMEFVVLFISNMHPARWVQKQARWIPVLMCIDVYKHISIHVYVYINVHMWIRGTFEWSE